MTDSENQESEDLEGQLAKLAADNERMMKIIMDLKKPPPSTKEKETDEDGSTCTLDDRHYGFTEHVLDQDIEWIKKALLEQEGPELAKRKYVKLLNLMGRVIPLNATEVKKESAINWEEQRNEAIKCIRDAASQLADPSITGKIPTRAEHWEDTTHEERTELGFPVSLDLSDPEILGRCIEHGLVSYALNQIADAISKIPGDKFRQIQNHDLLGIDASNIGVRGGTSNKYDQGRTKALLVKELADIVPENMAKRYGVIARFARFRDPTVDRHYVRATLMRGRT